MNTTVAHQPTPENGLVDTVRNAAPGRAFALFDRRAGDVELLLEARGTVWGSSDLEDGRRVVATLKLASFLADTICPRMNKFHL